jgi:hypothetical protein
MGLFPLEWLQQQLTAPGSSSSTLYSNLKQLLAFLNLPGCVLDWLPLKAMTLEHATPMKFYCKATAMQAVEDMLNYNPMLAGSSSSAQHCAAFLVTTTDKAGALLVRALKLSTGLALETSCSTAASQSTLHDYGNMSQSCVARHVMIVCGRRGTGSGSAAVRHLVALVTACGTPCLRESLAYLLLQRTLCLVRS